MRICKENKWNIIFQTRYGYFEYQVMSLGLTNTLETFQSYINKILTEKLNIVVIVYLNDILIYTKNKKKSHI